MSTCPELYWYDLQPSGAKTAERSMPEQAAGWHACTCRVLVRAKRRRACNATVMGQPSQGKNTGTILSHGVPHVATPEKGLRPIHHVAG